VAALFIWSESMGDWRTIRRCQHIKVNGTQCGSPARRKERYCHFHRENQPERVKVGGKGGVSILMPVLEDAQSIQTVVRQVAILVLGGKIDNQQAGLMLSALRIASTNLKRIEAEKPRPEQVVVDPEKVAKTPIGMTPWTTRERGWEREDEAVGFQGEIAQNLKRNARAVRERFGMHIQAARNLAKGARTELAREPRIDYDQLRYTLETLAQNVEQDLGQC
jgi:hypothetical protein